MATFFKRLASKDSWWNYICR